MRERLNRLRARWPWFDLIMAVQDRYSELEGGMVAAAVTLSIFISLFPALLVGTAIIGFIAQGRVDLSGQIIDKLGLTGNAADTLREAIGTASHSRKTASIVGLAGLAWSSLGVVQAIQLAVDRAWQVKGGAIIDKVKSLGWLVATGGLVAATTAGTAMVVSVLPGWIAPLMIIVTVAINVLMFWCTFALLGHQSVGWRALLPGAVFAGIALQVLTLAGAFIVPRSVASSSALYGSMGVVFAILAWLYFFGRLLVYASTLNVVLYEREQGTVTLEVEAPRMPGDVQLEATRSGVVVEAAAP
ncbi:MAG: rane protein [Acidimicrobiaceae bacterium]